MKINNFFKLKTNYLEIALKSILYFGLLLALIMLEILVFWLIFGEGAESGRIADLWYVDLLLKYLPFVIVGGFLVYLIISAYKKHQNVKFKTNLITLLILIFLFSIRHQLNALFF